MRSALKFWTDGVATLRRAVEGVSKILRKEAEVTQLEVMDSLRPRPKEGRRRGERGDRRERDVGEPGWTWAAQAAIVEKVFERRRMGVA